MAKLRPSLIKLKGTIMGVTFVDSKTYEPHARAARSTSAINDKLVQSKERLLNSNKPAKLIFDAVRDEHKDGLFWPNLLSVFRKQLKEDGYFSFKGLPKLECSRKHKLDRLVHGQFTVDAVVNEGMLDVTVTLLQHPWWVRMGYLDRYELTVIAVFPDFGEDTVSKTTVRTPPILFKDALIPIHFQLPMPSADAPWVLFMGLAGGRKEYIYDLPQHKGLAIVKVSEGVS